MTVTVNISPQTEEWLKHRADLLDVPVAEIVTALVEQVSQAEGPLPRYAPPPMPAVVTGMTPEQRIADLHEMLSDSPVGPSLPSEAFDRGELYG